MKEAQTQALYFHFIADRAAGTYEDMRIGPHHVYKIVWAISRFYSSYSLIHSLIKKELFNIMIDCKLQESFGIYRVFRPVLIYFRDLGDHLKITFRL